MPPRFTLEQLRADKYARYTIAKPLEMIGEAAARRSPGFRAAHPEIEWGPIIGFRNRLVHDDRNINLRVVWEVVQRELPGLIAELERLLPPEPEG